MLAMCLPGFKFFYCFSISMLLNFSLYYYPFLGHPSRPESNERKSILVQVIPYPMSLWDDVTVDRLVTFILWLFTAREHKVSHAKLVGGIWMSYIYIFSMLKLLKSNIWLLLFLLVYHQKRYLFLVEKTTLSSDVCVTFCNYTYHHPSIWEKNIKCQTYHTPPSTLNKANWIYIFTKFHSMSLSC